MTTSVDTSYGSWPATTPPFITKYGVVTNPSTSFSTGVIPDPYGAPFSLFTNNEQGVWYDPSDFSTMFQDSAGTTPVTAVEQPVGLILDKSKGLVLGPELVDTANIVAAWVVYGTNTVAQDGDAIKITYVDNALGAYVLLTGIGGLSSDPTVGKSYKISGEMKVNSGSSGVYTKLGSATFGGTQTTSSTTYVPFTYTLNASTNTAEYYLRASDLGVGEIVWFRNVSVRELTGNHATQATSTKRPVLSARVNLLTKTEQFDDAAWIKAGLTVAANAITAPDGTLTADKLIESATNAEHAINRTLTLQTNQKVTFCLKAGERTAASIRLYNSISNYCTVTFNLSLGTVTQTANVGTTYSAVSSTITPIEEGFYRCSVEATRASGTTYYGVNTNTTTTPTLDIYGSEIYLGDITKGIYIWGASLVPANQASLPYQRVNTATDYDTVGFPRYLKFDGVDDALATSSIDFTATDKMTVVAGVRKLSDAAAQELYELSVSADANNGTFGSLFGIGTNTHLFGSKGTINASLGTTSASYAAPSTAVQTGISSISSAIITLRVNGLSLGTNSSSQGTGNYGNYPLHLGSRAGTERFFNGHLYSLIIRGAQSTDAQIVSAETYVNSKTGAY